MKHVEAPLLTHYLLSPTHHHDIRKFAHSYVCAGELEVDIFHGLADGHYEGLHAVLSGTSTLAGAVVPLDKCARNLREFTQCSIPEVLAAVTTHPAR